MVKDIIEEEYPFYIGQKVTTSWGVGVVTEIHPKQWSDGGVRVKCENGDPIFSIHNAKPLEQYKPYGWMEE